MYRLVQRGLAALGVIAAIVLAAPAPAAAATPEAASLAQQVAGMLFQAADLKTTIAKSMQAEASSLDSFDFRPGWKDLLIASMVEETLHDLPALQRLLGDRFAEYFTVEELRAGVAMMQDPAVQAYIAAGTAGREPPAKAKPSRATERLIRTPAGAGFLKKFGEIDVVMDVLEDDFIAEILPGALRRFADKAEAAEAARVPAS